MKITRHVLSDVGILFATICLLMIAAAFTMVGVLMEASSPLANLPLVSHVGNSVTSYVAAGVMGEIPSTAGTIQSIGLFVGYVVAPFAVALMLAARESLPAEEPCEDVPVEDLDTAYAA